MKRKSVFFLLFGLILASFLCPSAAGESLDLTSPSITLYSNIPALVEFRGAERLEKGSNEITMNLPGSIVDDSIFVETSAGRVTDYTLKGGLSSQKGILASMKGKRIEVKTEGGTSSEKITGKLVEVIGGDPLLKTSEGSISLVKNPVGYTFPDFEEDSLGGILKIGIESSSNESSKLRLVFQQKGLSWEPVYKGIFDESNGELDLRAQALISNGTRKSYREADLTLVAGEPEYQKRKVFLARAENSKAASGGEPEREKLFEFHTYSFSRSFCLPAGEKKTISFAGAEEIPVKKSYLYRRAQRGDVYSFISFENTEDSGLGLPLPSGLFKLYSREKGLKFLGEKKLSNTPRGEEISLPIGKAFDILAEAKTAKHEKVGEEKWRDKVEIRLTNRKEEKVTVEVEEKLKGSWDIVESSAKYERLDSRHVKFYVDVPADNSTRITYTYQYRY